MKQRYTLVLIAAAVVVIGLLGFLFYNLGQRSCGKPSVACTKEAKLCPDGSAVGRTGPNCEFAECPGTKGVGEGA